MARSIGIMPATINGIGTRYSGKREVQVEDGICGSCGKAARLSSYDTRLWFSILFIPVIPLGRKRVLAECSRCRRHQVMPLDTYREFQQETLTQLEADWRRDRKDLDKAIAYNSALREFGRADEASNHLAELLRTFEDDARAQYYAGTVCAATGRAEEAPRFFALAFQIDPTFPPARRARALQMIREGSLDQASSLLSPSSLAPEETDPALLFLLAEGYRERGDHVNALAVDQRLIRDFPGIEQGKEFRRAVKRSEKALIAPQTILAKRQLPWGRLAAAAAIVLLLVGGGLGYNLYRRGHHQVHIVNGYPGPVTVSIDDTTELAFATVGRDVVTVGEGPHRVVASGAIDDAIDFAIDGTFWSRFSSDPIYLVNLRGLAVVMQEDVTYSASPRDTADPAVRLLAGESFAVVHDVDYPFVELPAEIDLPSSSSSVQKRHLDLLEGGPEVLSGWVLAEGGAKTGLDYVEAWLEVEPSDVLALTYSSVAATAGETGRAVARLRPGLTLEPPNVDWHRAYQQVAQTEDLPALKAEYARYLSAAPGDPDLLYLCGRIEPDPALALSYYDRALARAPQHPFALRASAYALSSLGEFGRAVELLRSSLDLGAAEPEVVDSYLDAAIAAGDDATVREVIAARLLAAGEDFRWDDASRLALVEVRAGNSQQARDLATRLAAEDDPFRPWIESQLLYAENDIEALRALIRRDDFPYLWRDEMEFWVAVESNDVRAANQALLRMDAATSDGLNELVASLLFARAGMANAAEQWAAAGLASLGRGQPEAAIAAELLAGERPLSRAAVDLLAIEPRYKAPILTLLALEFADESGWLLAEADRFNYLPRFPHHFLASFAADPPPTS